jgi:hypothetical protein
MKWAGQIKCYVVLSIVNDIWTVKKSRLKVETLSAITFVKYNVNMSCDAFSTKLSGNEQLLKKIHSSKKYT